MYLYCRIWKESEDDNYWFHFVTWRSIWTFPWIQSALLCGDHLLVWHCDAAQSNARKMMKNLIKSLIPFYVSIKVKSMFLSTCNSYRKFLMVNFLMMRSINMIKLRWGTAQRGKIWKLNHQRLNECQGW